MMNSGTKKWKHVKLVHQDGYHPVSCELEVPELKPGEKVELVHVHCRTLIVRAS